MELIYLSQRLPYPPDRGDRIAAFHHIRHLARNHRVTVFSLIESDREQQQIEGLRQWAADVAAGKRTRLGSARGMLAAFLRGRPLTLGYFYSPHLHEEIKKLLARRRIDAAILFSSSMAQYLEGCGGLKRIMYFCDVDSQKWAELANSSRGLKRRIYSREARLLLEYERKIAHQFEASCVVTEGEAAIFRRLIPDVPVYVIENGVDLQFFQSARKDIRQELVFVGVMDYPPNEEAAGFFARSVWPQVRARFPSAQFTIVGARPSAAVCRLAKLPGVRVTGYVEDIRRFLARAALAVIPLAVARGIQNKVLEAMAAGVPVLTTPAVADNLRPELRSMIHVAERNSAQFLDIISTILNDPADADRRAQDAIAVLREHCSWERAGEKLEHLLEMVVGKHRER